MVESIVRSVKRACHAGLDSVALRREVAALVRPAVAFDAHAFGTTDPDTGLLSHLVAAQMPEPMALAYIHRLYPFDSARYAMDAARRGRIVYATGEESDEIRDAMRDNGFAQGTHVLMATGSRLWGKWCLLAERASPRIVERERALLQRIAPELTRGLQNAALLDAARSARENDGTLTGVVVLDASGRPLMRTESARPMLEDLSDVGVAYPDGIPLAVRTALTRLTWQLRTGGLDAAASISLRTQGRSGGWYAIQACLAEAAATGHTIVVIRPIVAREIAAMLTDLYGLSPREREIVAAVARGLSTKEIAAELRLSPHTVKEHLDRACDKTGARGRKALVARLFFDAYAPRLAATWIDA